MANSTFLLPYVATSFSLFPAAGISLPSIVVSKGRTCAGHFTTVNNIKERFVKSCMLMYAIFICWLHGQSQVNSVSKPPASQQPIFHRHFDSYFLKTEYENHFTRLTWQNMTIITEIQIPFGPSKCTTGPKSACELLIPPECQTVIQSTWLYPYYIWFNVEIHVHIYIECYWQLFVCVRWHVWLWFADAVVACCWHWAMLIAIKLSLSESEGGLFIWKLIWIAMMAPDSVVHMKLIGLFYTVWSALKCFHS